MPGKGDVQIFPIRHRQERPVIFHADHFCFARALRLVRRHRVTLPYPTVIEPEIQTRFEADLVALNCSDRLPGTIFVGLPVRLDLLCQEQHLARPSFQRCPLKNGGHLIEAEIASPIHAPCGSQQQTIVCGRTGF